MTKLSTDPRILTLCAQVTAKRARAVIDHIISHGSVTTEEIQALGYDHAPRAARDVRERGIPLETFTVTSKRSGRSIAAYRFGDPSQILQGRLGGRKALPKALKLALIERDGCEDRFTRVRLPATVLTIDHRIPYEVSGDCTDIDPEDFMLLDASSQRAKSWSCENCSNWQSTKDPDICRACYWAFPEQYEHMALTQIRRLDLAWTGEDAAVYDLFLQHARAQGGEVQDVAKQAIQEYLQRHNEV